MDKVQFAGEFKLDKCELISSTGTFADISAIVVEINIFESIFKTALTGSVIITDTNNLVDNMPIVGQEFLSLKISTPGLVNKDLAYDFTENVFCVYELGGRTPSTPNSEVIELKICSPELLKNHRVRVSKAYEETVDKIVTSILENPKYINTRKDLFIEETQGIRKIVSPNLNPYNLISNLARESISADDESPHFLFFENMRGFHFRSIQSMYSQGSEGEYHYGDKGFNEDLFGAGGDSGKLAQAYRRIINISVPNKNNSLLDIKGGMLGSTLIMHDIYNKKYNKSTFSYFDDYEKYGRIENSPKYNNVLVDDENTVGSFTDARIYLHPTSTTKDDKDSQYIVVPDTVEELIEQGVDRGLAQAEVDRQQKEIAEGNKDYMSNRANKWLLHRKQRLHELNSGMTVNMSINGNTTVEAGQVIQINFPIFGRDHENTKLSKYQTGKYLISKLRHTFNPPTKTHTISLQATKDSLPEDVGQGLTSSYPEPKKSKKDQNFIDATTMNYIKEAFGSKQSGPF